VPNRIIKESICTSNEIDALKPEEEILFYRIIVNCDDFGRMDARLPILRAKCFPAGDQNFKDCALAVFFVKHGAICSTGDVAKVLNKIEKGGRLAVMEKSEHYKNRKAQCLHARR